jgi:hypothetical protein
MSKKLFVLKPVEVYRDGSQSYPGRLFLIAVIVGSYSIRLSKALSSNY